MPCFISSRLIFKRTKTFTDALDTKKKGHGEAVGWRRTEKTRTVNGLTLRTHSFGCENQKAFTFGKLYYFWIKSTHVEHFLDSCVATVFVRTFGISFSQLKLKWNCQMVTQMVEEIYPKWCLDNSRLNYIKNISKKEGNGSIKTINHKTNHFLFHQKQVCVSSNKTIRGPPKMGGILIQIIQLCDVFHLVQGIGPHRFERCVISHGTIFSKNRRSG